MSLIISEKYNSIVKYHTITIKAPNKSISEIESKYITNQIFDRLLNFNLSYFYEERFFVCPAHGLENLLDYLKLQKISYEIKDEFDEKINEMSIDEIVTYTVWDQLYYSFKISMSNIKVHEFFNNIADASFKYAGEIKNQRWWIVPRYELDKVLNTLDNNNILYQFKPGKSKDFGDGKWNSKTQKDVIVKITKVNDSVLSVNFNFNSIVVDLIKQIPGKKYNMAVKEWTIPTQFCSEYIEKLKKQCHCLRSTWPIN